eukprot:6199231-Pleurochrysis_carterae.AAC.2
MEACYINNKASNSPSARLHRHARGKEPSLLIRTPPCASGYRLNTLINRAKMHKYQCQNMQMRMHDDQFRNLPFQSDPRDSSS